MKKLCLLLLGAGILTAMRALDKPFTVPENWPKPHYDFSANPLDDRKVALGRRLFYDPLLSEDNTISCASCHSPYNAFAHSDHAVSHGIHDRFGTRNAPSLQNLAWQRSFMWDGAIHYLDQQALAPISHPDEMGETIAHVVEKLNHDKRYRTLFYHAFDDSTATGERTLKSLSQFLLTLVSASSKYDSVKSSLARFTEQEAKGESIFEARCKSCHAPPLFTNNGFANNGLPIDPVYNDIGRMKNTRDPLDAYRFKVPTLRNIAYTAPYMHDGRFKRLGDVINHYSSGIIDSPTLSKELRQSKPLTSDERTDLIAFLLTLSDRSFLFDNRHTDPWIMDHAQSTFMDQ